MFVVSVLYPNTEGKHFDLDYYTGRHLPLVHRLLDPKGLRSLTYYQPAPGAPFRLVAEMRFDDGKAARAALSAHGAETQADIPNFTDEAPIILMAPLVSG
ncbi:MAG: EthD family reductase [Pararhodobacter sp.]|nr:EthD family reductase [Pararhodobacter sp.]